MNEIMNVEIKGAEYIDINSATQNARMVGYLEGADMMTGKYLEASKKCKRNTVLFFIVGCVSGYFLSKRLEKKNRDKRTREEKYSDAYGKGDNIL